MEQTQTIKESTPQELQQKIYENTNRAEKLHQKPLDAPGLVPAPTEIDPNTIAVVAAIEAGTPYIAILDDGKSVKLSSCQISQPAMLGLLVKIVHKLTTQDISSDINNG